MSTYRINSKLQFKGFLTSLEVKRLERSLIMYQHDIQYLNRNANENVVSVPLRVEQVNGEMAFELTEATTRDINKLSDLLNDRRPLKIKLTIESIESI